MAALSRDTSLGGASADSYAYVEEDGSEGGMSASLTEVAARASRLWSSGAAGLPPTIKPGEDSVCYESILLVDKMEDRVISTAEVLSVSPDEALLLLVGNKWRQDVVVEKYVADPGAMRRDCGVAAGGDPHAALAEAVARNEDVIDPVELETYPATECDAAACGHLFPISTWRSYLRSTLASPLGMLSTRCIDFAPPVCCNERVRPRMWRSYLSPDDFDLYLREIVRSFLGSGNSGHGARLYPCPTGGCNLVVETRMMSPAKFANCSAGHAWCVLCNLEPHAPATCKSVDAWNMRERDDGANAMWILANTKSCPNCKKAIEKNQGCNHMVCRREAGGCAHEFCWQCLNTWASHITAGGSGYQCNKRPDKLTFDEEKSSLAKNNLDFYMFYHGKVVSQSADRRHAIAELAKYDDKVSVMTATLTASGFVPPYGTFQFFKEALQTVVNSRLVAKYAYVHAFFLDKGPELNLFEFSQALMEQNIEKLVSLIGDRTLSEVFQKQRENKTAWDVINHFTCVNKFVTDLNNAVEEGFLKGADLRGGASGGAGGGASVSGTVDDEIETLGKRPRSTK